MQPAIKDKIMQQHNFTNYYRVYQHDTAVTKVSANDFKQVITHIAFPPVYSLPTDGTMFYGYLNQIEAMEKAKAGALAYINGIIQKVDEGIDQLKQYRVDHYQDLNINLLDTHIRRLEQEMHIK
jgi:hypothetical protein